MHSRYLKIIVLSALLVLALQADAWAHVYLDRAEPKVGSEQDQPPADVRIWFTGVVVAESTIEVFDADSKEVDKKDTHVDEADKTLLIVSLPKLSPGVYKARWHAVSRDSHKTQGEFKFTINAK